MPSSGVGIFTNPTSVWGAAVILNNDGGQSLRVSHGLPIYNVSDYANDFDLAAAAIGGGPGILHVNVNCICSVNTTLGAEIELKVQDGRRITVNNGVTLTLNSVEMVKASLRQRIFTLIGTGVVAFGSTGTASPHWWGAMGDGVTNDRAAILAASAAIGNGILKFPAGVHWSTGGDLTVPDGQTWTGTGQMASSIQVDSTAGDEILCSDYTRLRRLRLLGNGTGTVVRNVLGEAYIVIEDCRIFGAENGLNFAGTWGCEVRDTLLTQCTNAGVLIGPTAVAADVTRALQFTNVSISDCLNAVQITGGAVHYHQTITFNGCRFQGSTGAAVSINDTSYDLTFTDGCWWENNASDIVSIGASTHNLTVTNCTFKTGVYAIPGTYYALDLSIGTHRCVHVASNHFYTDVGWNAALQPILVGANLQTALLEANEVAGTYTGLISGVPATAHLDRFCNQIAGVVEPDRIDKVTLPATTGAAGNVLTSDGVGGSSWAAGGGGGLGYVLGCVSSTHAPNDATTYYFGQLVIAPTTVANLRKIYIPKAGTIKAAVIWCKAYNVAGSDEDWYLYVRLNDTTDTLIQIRGVATSERLFANYALNIPVVAGDYIEIKAVTPTWATNPTDVAYMGSIYIE